jgi:hypothetical protein
VFGLEQRGYFQGGSFVPGVLIDHPEVVEQLHRDLVHAGSDVTHREVWTRQRPGYGRPDSMGARRRRLQQPRRPHKAMRLDTTSTGDWQRKIPARLPAHAGVRRASCTVGCLSLTQLAWASSWTIARTTLALLRLRTAQRFATFRDPTPDEERVTPAQLTLVPALVLRLTFLSTLIWRTMSRAMPDAGQNAGRRTNAGLPTESDLADVALEQAWF